MKWATEWLLAAAVVASPVAAQAGREAHHEGFWISFGLGGGSNMSEGFAGNRGGGAAYLRMGGTVNPQLLIGGEGLSWARQESNTTVSQGNTTAVIVFYPSPAGGLFLKSGLGFANSIARQDFGNTTITTTDVGFGATFGGGFDVQLGNNFFLTPGLDFLVQTIEGSTGGLVLVTIGATWH